MCFRALNEGIPGWAKRAVEHTKKHTSLSCRSQFEIGAGAEDLHSPPPFSLVICISCRLHTFVLLWVDLTLLIYPSSNKVSKWMKTDPTSCCFILRQVVSRLFKSHES